MAAKLRVSLPLIAQALFEDEPVKIEAIYQDEDGRQNGYVIMKLSGPYVPDVEDVQCHVTQERRTFRFVPVEPMPESELVKINGTCH